jgi:hypothetical protein
MWSGCIAGLSHPATYKPGPALTRRNHGEPKARIDIAAYKEKSSRAAEPDRRTGQGHKKIVEEDRLLCGGLGQFSAVHEALRGVGKLMMPLS